MNRKELKSLNQDQFLMFGQKIGQKLKGGEVFELISDLGGGKTTLTKSIVKGSKSSDQVSSPSFTICNEYKALKFTIYHFDFFTSFPSTSSIHFSSKAPTPPLIPHPWQYYLQ